MSQDPTHPEPTADQASLEEQLVAYLDGELDDESSHRVEELLASDPGVRETLERLEGTWDLLDSLERAHVGEFFTKSTLEMVAVEAAEDVQKQQAEAPRRWQRRLIAGAAILLAGAAGFLGVLVFQPSPNEQLLRDLPVLERLDQYRQIDDGRAHARNEKDPTIEFLELLLEHRDDLFPKDSPDES